MITNITILALNKRFKKLVAKKLAKKLDMFYIDTLDIIKFDMEAYKNTMSSGGIDYYSKLENDAFKRVCGFENTVITTDLNLINRDNNLSLLKKSSLLIYLNLEYDFYKEKLIKERPRSNIYEENLNLSIFEERNKLISNFSDINLKVTQKNENKLIDLIIKEIKKYYNKIYKK